MPRSYFIKARSAGHTFISYVDLKPPGILLDCPWWGKAACHQSIVHAAASNGCVGGFTRCPTSYLSVYLYRMSFPPRIPTQCVGHLPCLWLSELNRLHWRAGRRGPLCCPANRTP